MKNKYFVSALILCIGIVVSSFIISDATKAKAQTSDIQYPVAELGGCKNETDCRSYCDDTKNADVCFAFAEKNNLMSPEEIQTAKNFIKAGNKGPGNCSSKEECDKYCNDINNINECVSFAEKNGIMSGKELEEAKKVQAAIAKGIKPPACSGKKDCDNYCNDSAHMEECIAFSKAAGMMSEQEQQDSEKMLAALKKGVKPPACKGKEECDKYCNDSAHMEECMTFAIAAGFMSAEEAQNSQKMIEAMKKGVKPPACKGKEECDKYCGDPAHTEECINFSVAAGMMSPEEATMAKKTGGKGPGGCSSKEACEAFCNDPSNQETCFNFGKDNGMIPPEELQKMEQSKKEFSNMLNQAPTETITCISNAIGNDNLEKLKSGSIMPSQNIGEKMGGCFSQFKGPNGPGEEGNMQPGGQGSGEFQPGPGVMNPGNQMMPQQSGPGGCKTPEECQSFCQSNPDACKNFGPSGNQNGPMQGPPNQEQMQQMPGSPGMEGNYAPGLEQFRTNEPGQYIKPGIPGMPNQPMDGLKVIDMSEGATMPNMPMDINNLNVNSMPSVQQMQGIIQQMQPGTMEGGGQQNFGPQPSMQPGTTGGPMQQQFQQPMQQFQSGPSGPPPSEGMMQQPMMQQPNMMPGTPPNGETMGPPPNNPPAGGSLLDAIKSFFGF